jgi:hypothetical protein
MRLHMANVHLTRAHYLHDNTEFAKARLLIERCGYYRRDDELADAEAAAAPWPDSADGAVLTRTAVASALTPSAPVIWGAKKGPLSPVSPGQTQYVLTQTQNTSAKAG